MLRKLLVAMVMLLVGTAAHAEYPERAIRLIVPSHPAAAATFRPA